jgi:hypothetical protein
MPPRPAPSGAQKQRPCADAGDRDAGTAGGPIVAADRLDVATQARALGDAGRDRRHEKREEEDQRERPDGLVGEGE